MGNTIPYSISDTEPIETTQDETSKQTTVFLTVPSIPYPSDAAIEPQSVPQSVPDMIDLRSVIEVPYRVNHPNYMKHRANLEIVARQLECMASECGAWKGRISRVFWEE
jgi:hypothetical protein